MTILLVLSFSLVISGSMVYIVRERVNGEKLQQQLCGINFPTYWSVAIVWDLGVICSVGLCARELKLIVICDQDLYFCSL